VAAVLLTCMTAILLSGCGLTAALTSFRPIAFAALPAADAQYGSHVLNDGTYACVCCTASNVAQRQAGMRHASSSRTVHVLYGDTVVVVNQCRRPQSGCCSRRATQLQCLCCVCCVSSC
jgi:hypothetical protein